MSDSKRRSSKQGNEEKQGRKRSRQQRKNAQEGVDELRIPGVPPDVTVALVEAIRATKSAFQHQETPLLWNPNEIEDQLNQLNQRKNKRGDNGVLESVLHRVEAATTEKRDKKAERQQRMKQAQESWLDAVERTLNNSLQQQKSDGVTPVAAEEGAAAAIPTKKPSVSVALASFLYVWKLQEHARVSVRRASLHLCGQLLWKSEECRERWIESGQLLEWIRAVVDGAGVGDEYRAQMPLWQAEAIRWVRLFSESFQETQFRVALRLLHQQCPEILQQDDCDVKEHQSASTQHGLNNNMHSWRRIRDIAMQYGEKEISIAEKLIGKAHKAMDVLVPRMGNGTSAEPGPSTQLEDEDDDEDDEDDDIDWEDGDEEGVDEAHTDAVERTLMEMTSVGALQGGNLEIDFRATDSLQTSSTPGHEPNDNTTESRARTQLEKAIQLLTTKHLPRLSSWVRGLTNADSLVVKRHALVAMPFDQSRKQTELLDRLVQLKSLVASVIAAATKLKVEVTNAQQTSSTPPLRGQSMVGRQSTASREHLHMVRLVESRRNRRAQSSKRRSTAIQVKYRKR